MYEANPIFVQPDREDVRVWRYMDFTKFVSLIESRCLYFTRADKFDDPFEGSWPKINIDALHLPFPDITQETQEAYIASMKSMNQNFPKFHAINCWHMNEHESAAMWKLYLKSNEGIAIQSTYRKLRESIIDDETIHLGVVKYIDYEKEWIDTTNNFLSPFAHKRKSFEHEREVRALLTKFPTSKDGINISQETIAHGVKIRVNVELLIEKIYVAPSAPGWLSGLVNSVSERYGYKFEVVHSKLDEQPVF